MNHHRRVPQCKGFTLLELVTTLAIAAIALAAVLPSAGAFVREHRVAAAAERLASALTLARTTATARRSYVTVAPLGKGWPEGWRVFVEKGQPDGVLDAADTLILHEDRVASDLTTTTRGTLPLTFTPLGHMQTAGRPTDSERIDFRIESATRVVEIGTRGRVRVCNPAGKSSAC